MDAWRDDHDGLVDAYQTPRCFGCSPPPDRRRALHRVTFGFDDFLQAYDGFERVGETGALKVESDLRQAACSSR